MWLVKIGFVSSVWWKGNDLVAVWPQWSRDDNFRNFSFKEIGNERSVTDKHHWTIENTEFAWKFLQQYKYSSVVWQIERTQAQLRMNLIAYLLWLYGISTRVCVCGKTFTHTVRRRTIYICCVSMCRTFTLQLTSIDWIIVTSMTIAGVDLVYLFLAFNKINFVHMQACVRSLARELAEQFLWFHS